jgi:hypothetical protein
MTLAAYLLHIFKPQVQYSAVLQRGLAWANHSGLKRMRPYLYYYAASACHILFIGLLRPITSSVNWATLGMICLSNRIGLSRKHPTI